MAAELVRRQVAVIVANGLAVPAVKAATATNSRTPLMIPMRRLPPRR